MKKSIYGYSSVIRSLLVFLMSVFVFVCSAQFGGGAGTEDDPYIISRAVHLHNIRGDFLNAHFLQTVDLDLSPEELQDEEWYDQESGWRPIDWSVDDDNQQVVLPFTGFYDGNGFEIRNLTINRPDYNSQALFYRTAGATIKNVHMRDVELRGRRNGGAIVGNLRGGSILKNSSSTGNLFSPNNQWQHGGLIGDAFNSTIINCYSYANITSGGGRCGGIAGWLNSSHIFDSYARGDVSAVNVGVVGGLVGLIQRWGEGEGASTVTNSYATGNVTGANQTGGLVGVAQGEVTITNSYWDTQTTGMNVSAGGGTGRTSLEMTHPYAGEPHTFAEWDFEEIWVNDDTHDLNNGYPMLFFQDGDDDREFAGGEGTEENPWRIANANHLNNVRNYLGEENDDKYFFQVANIALEEAPWNEEEGWEPIGTSPEESFQGHYNGNGYVITGLMIDREEGNHQGLFGYTIGGIIVDLSVTDINISGQDWVGGIIGYSRSTSVLNSYSTGTVSGRNRVGGLTGLSFEQSSAENCFTEVAVDGMAWVGGLVGENYQSTIDNSYARESVNGTTRVGGLVGQNNQDSVIRYSYSTGRVSSPNIVNVGGLVGENDAQVITSYWDIVSSNQQLSAGGSGRETADMVYPYAGNTYVDWDFDDIWRHDALQEDNDGYPILHYQYDQFFAGGYGTENDPWQIETADHLNFLREYLGEEHSNKYFVQTSDIDLGVGPWNEGDGWIPIGNNEAFFAGNYDGDGFAINHLTIRRDMNYQALFGITEGAVFKNISLEQVEVNADSYSGGLIGHAQATTIKNCFVGGEITGTAHLGAIAGHIEGESEINGCFSYGQMTAHAVDSYIGGITGYNQGSTIRDSYSVMQLNGNQNFIGGLIGKNQAGTIARSYAIGYLSTQEPSESIGGLVGAFEEIEISASFWNIHTTGQEESPGGGTGISTPQMVQQATFAEAGWDFEEIWSINDGETFPFLSYQEVAALHNIPGPYNLAAEIDDEEGEVSLEWEMAGAPQRYFVYRNNNRITSVNHPTRTFDDVNAPQAVDLTYWVTAVFTEDDEEIETTASNRVYAHLTPGFAGGQGTEDDPFQINSASMLNSVRHFLDSHYIQTADINLDEAPWNEGEGWVPIGTSAERFTGSYNGDNYLISGLMINRDAGNMGLFGYINGSLIQNVHLVDVNIQGRTQIGALVGIMDDDSVVRSCSSNGQINIDGAHRHIGGLVGWCLNSLVTDSYSQVNIEGGERVGGLVGWLNGGQVRNSYATGNLNVATGVSGGLVGLIQTWGPGEGIGTISNSYARGDVTGNVQMGGLVGTITIAGDIVSHCYSTGRVTGAGGGLVGQSNQENTVSNSYWDTETSERDNSPGGGEGRLTRQMIYPYDLNEAFVRWDFENIWRFDNTFVHNQIPGINDGYPYIYFQEGDIIPLDAPEVNIEIVYIGEEPFALLTWEEVEDAVSYHIYASSDAEAEDWGEPLDTVEELEFRIPVGENLLRFFKVVATIYDAP